MRGIAEKSRLVARMQAQYLLSCGSATVCSEIPIRPEGSGSGDVRICERFSHGFRRLCPSASALLARDGQLFSIRILSCLGSSEAQGV